MSLEAKEKEFKKAKEQAVKAYEVVLAVQTAVAEFGNAALKQVCLPVALEFEESQREIKEQLKDFLEFARAQQTDYEEEVEVARLRVRETEEALHKLGEL